MDEIDEKPVDAQVGGEFRMEGCRHGVALADEDGKAFSLGKDLDFRAGDDDAWSADEDGFERAASELGVQGEDRRVALGAVGVAFDGDVEDAEAELVRVADFFRQQDGSGAGAEDWLLLGECFQGVKEAAAIKKLQHGCRFAAGENQGVQIVESFGGLDEGGLRAGFFESGCVAFVVPLDGEDADLRRTMIGQWAFLSEAGRDNSRLFLF